MVKWSPDAWLHAQRFSSKINLLDIFELLEYMTYGYAQVLDQYACAYFRIFCDTVHIWQIERQREYWNEASI